MKKIAAAIILTLLSTSMLELAPQTVEAQSTEIYVLPQENTFNYCGTLPGSRFNVTVWVRDVVDLAIWQVFVSYDSTILNCTRAWEPTWDTQYVFYNRNTLRAGPTLGVNYTIIAVSLLPQPPLQPSFNGTGKLCIIEFEITAAPPSDGENLSCVLDITETEPYDTYLLDSNGTTIASTKTNAEYYYMKGQAGFGPRMNRLSIKYFSSRPDLYNALKNGEVDLTDGQLTQAQMGEVFNDTTIQAAISPSPAIYEFDLNNNATTPTYPGWINPTAYKGFRQGIAYLVNKTHIVNDICNYAYRVDTPVPRPTYEWWADIGSYPYEYDPNLAADCLDSSGFVQGNTSNPYYDENFPSSAHYLRTYPAGHPKYGEDLDPLNFYILETSPQRLDAGEYLMDNLRKMGIPVNATETDMSTCLAKVVTERDYHIFVGGWITYNGFDSLLCYSSKDYWGYNYVQFRNATYDEWTEELMQPRDLMAARNASLTCQRILVEEAACVWLWSSSRVMGYRDLCGVVNARGGRIDNQWTFLKAQTQINSTRTEINYGLYNPPSSLNVITDYWPSRSSWANVETPVKDCLDRIYDTLLSYGPYDKTPGRDGETMPWMAVDWDVGEWESPYEPGKNLTKLTFYLRDGIWWHDGVELDSSDVKFTIEYVKQLGNLSTLYDSVADVDHVTTPNARTVVVYENVSSIWTLDDIGTLPILPKHIFQSVTNVTGYTPGAGQGLPASQALIGCGPWKYVSHNSSMLCLEANRGYFMETPPRAEIDFRYDWKMGCWTVDTMDETMAGEACDTAGNGTPPAKWEPGCDLDGDCVVDVTDMITVANEYNMTWGRSAQHMLAQPSTDCAIYVETSTNQVLVGENFTVYVKVMNVNELSGYQFKLDYDNTALNCLNLNLPQIFETSHYLEAKKVMEQAQGLIWCSVALMGSTQPVSGNITLAAISFNATQPGGSTFNLYDTKLAKYGAPGLTCQPMAHKTIDGGIIVGVETLAGTNVKVAPAENAQVTFAETTTEGVTTLNITQAPSTEFASVLVNDIKTTATYTGNITLQFAYDPTGLSLEDEQATKIWLWNQTSRTWLDITTHVDTDNNIVYGVTRHLSMFGVTRSLCLELNVSKQGDTFVGTPESPPDPPKGLMALSYYQIETTCVYTGPVNIRLEYNDEAVFPGTENFVQLWQWNETSTTWFDITTSVDTVNNIVYGQAPHLSMFGVTCIMPPETGFAVVDANCSKTVVGIGYNLTISVTVKNMGDFTQDFDVFVYVNDTSIYGRTVSDLAPNGQTTITFAWNTTGWAKGNYTIHTVDHLISWEIVTIAGDVTSRNPEIPDYKVDMRDIGFVCSKFMKKDPNCDINGDGVVNMRDIGIACSNFMKDP